MIAGFLNGLVLSSFVGCVVWLVMFVLKPVTKRLFSQTWHFYAGLVPLVFLFGFAWFVSTLRLGGAYFPQVISAVGAFENVLLTQAVVASGETIVAASNTGISTSAAFIDAVFAIWVAGCFLFLTYKTGSYLMFRRGVLRGNKPFKHNVCPLPVVVSEHSFTPMLMGVIRPIIVLPKREYSDKETELILAHELTHWKRGHMLIKLLFFIANAIHWFNPLVYLINNSVNALSEGACDEAVVRHMDKAERLIYGNVILSAMEYGAAQKVAFCSGISSGFNVKRRLLEMMSFKKMKWPVAVFSVIVAAIFFASGVFAAVTGELLPLFTTPPSLESTIIENSATDEYSVFVQIASKVFGVGPHTRFYAGSNDQAGTSIYEMSRMNYSERVISHSLAIGTSMAQYVEEVPVITNLTTLGPVFPAEGINSISFRFEGINVAFARAIGPYVYMVSEYTNITMVDEYFPVYKNQGERIGDELCFSVAPRKPVSVNSGHTLYIPEGFNLPDISTLLIGEVIIQRN